MARASRALLERLGVTAGRLTSSSYAGAARVRVVWEGPQLANSGMALVNRELTRRLRRSPRLEFSPVYETSCPYEGPPADVYVRHLWPPNFERPPGGRLVVFQAWEYGSLPKAWVASINSGVDEAWVYSTYARDCYIQSGVEPSKVVVIPAGIDPDRFHPGSPALALPTRKRFKFLFVGGTIARKGIDLLLRAYLDTFSPQDDVALVIKDFGADTYYRGQTLRDEIRRLQSDPNNAEIVYLDAELPPEAMPGLYAACQCLVQPYRGEGFCLPIAEAMACGLPVIAPHYGACLDFCDVSVAYLLPAVEVWWPEARIDHLETVEVPWWCQVDGAALGLAMRRALREPGEASRLGKRASHRIRRGFTWKRSADRVLSRLEILAGRASPRLRARRLSVCMIVKNEERSLPRCLESVHGLADEIIVVDTGSTDLTTEVARRHGARVSRVAWTGSMSVARNEALRRATGDWILVLDGDETLDRASHAEVRRLMQTGQLVGYMLREFNYTDREGTSSVVEHLNLRLFPNHPDLRYVGHYHEQVRPRRSNLTFRVAPSRAIIHHDGYRPQAFKPEKLEGIRRMLEADVRDQPDEPFHAYNLGRTCLLLGRTAEAERELVRAVELCARQQAATSIFPQYLVNVLTMLAQLLIAQGRHAEAAERCRQALALAADFADAHALLGDAEFGLGRLTEAVSCYERALACGQRPAFGSTDRALAGWKAWLGIAEVALAEERREDALAFLTRANQLAPDHPAIMMAMARVQQGQGRLVEAEEVFRRAGASPAVAPSHPGAGGEARPSS